MELEYRRGSTWFKLDIPEGSKPDYYITQVCADEYILYSNFAKNEIVEHIKHPSIYSKTRS